MTLVPLIILLYSGFEKMPLYNEMTDFELVNLLKEDDHAAYREIYHRYTGILISHAYSKLQNRDEAKDVVQEVFSSLWSKRSTIHFQLNISGYLYITLRNKIINILAHRRIQTDYKNSLQLYLNQSHEGTDFLARSNQLRAIIEAEIAKMPVRMREVFELSRKSQLSHKEIAEKLGISEKTVKDHVKNALKTLRLKLGIINYLLFLYFL